MSTGGDQGSHALRSERYNRPKVYDQARAALTLSSSTPGRFKSSGDLEHLRDFALWLNNYAEGGDNEHNAIKSWFYWSWNANSGDTGGLVDDTWRNLEWVKLNFLTDSLGLNPWYATDNEQMLVYMSEGGGRR